MTLPPSPPPLPSTEERREALVPLFGLLRRHRHLSVPAAVPPGFLAAGEVLAHLPNAGIPTVAASVALGGSVYVMAPHKWTGDDGEPRWPEVWYARLSALAAGGYLSWAAIAGLHIPELLAAAPLALAWGIPWWWHKRPRNHAQAVVTEWQQWWAHHASHWPNLFGSHVLDVTTEGVIDTLWVQLVGGRQHVKDVQQILGLLESALQGHVAPGMTRCENVPGRGDQVLVHLKRANPHDEEVEWDPELAPESITGLMPIGKDEHGEWVMVPCMALNWFINGALGSGKSNMLSVLLASITGCPDARVWLIDRKGGKAARPWLGAVDWVATTTEEARLMQRAYLAEVRARALDGYDGNEEMTPTPEVPAIFLVIDEAHNVVANPPSGDLECQALLSDGVSECRSSAQRAIVATQYGSLPESVGTEQTRGNLLNRLCFRVATAANGQFTLPDYARLDASRLDNPGEFYYWLKDATASAPARAPHLPHGLVRTIAARNAEIERPPLVLFASDHQAVYDTRWDRAPAAFRPASTRPSPAVPVPEVPVIPEPVRRGFGPEPKWAPEAMARIADDVNSLPDAPHPARVDEAAMRRTADGQKHLWSLLLQHAPPEGITPRELMGKSGLHNSWTHDYLRDLTAMGVITKMSRGHYRGVPGQDVYQAVQDRGAQLAREARELVNAA